MTRFVLLSALLLGACDPGDPGDPGGTDTDAGSGTGGDLSDCADVMLEPYACPETPWTADPIVTCMIGACVYECTFGVCDDGQWTYDCHPADPECGG